MCFVLQIRSIINYAYGWQQMLALPLNSGNIAFPSWSSLWVAAIAPPPPCSLSSLAVGIWSAKLSSGLGEDWREGSVLASFALLAASPLATAEWHLRFPLARGVKIFSSSTRTQPSGQKQRAELSNKHMLWLGKQMFIKQYIICCSLHGNIYRDTLWIGTAASLRYILSLRCPFHFILMPASL